MTHLALSLHAAHRSPVQCQHGAEESTSDCIRGLSLNSHWELFLDAGKALQVWSHVRDIICLWTDSGLVTLTCRLYTCVFNVSHLCVVSSYFHYFFPSSHLIFGKLSKKKYILCPVTSGQFYLNPHSVTLGQAGFHPVIVLSGST